MLSRNVIRRVGLVTTALLALAIIGGGTTLAYQRPGGGTGSVHVAYMNRTLHTLTARTYVTASGMNPQSVRANVWICDSRNACYDMGVREQLLNTGQWGECCGPQVIFDWPTPPLPTARSSNEPAIYYRFHARYAWYTTSGWQWSPFEVTPWYQP